MADLDALGLPGGALEALRKIKEQKIARFIGFTGHVDAAAMAEAARRHDFDTMLIALNHYQERRGDLEGGAIPAAADRGMGVMIIKAIRPRETVEGLAAADLLRYALTLPLVHSAVVGTDSVEVVRKNAALLRDFRPLSPEEMSAPRGQARAVLRRPRRPLDAARLPGRGVRLMRRPGTALPLAAAVGPGLARLRVRPGIRPADPGPS